MMLCQVFVSLISFYSAFGFPSDQYLFDPEPVSQASVPNQQYIFNYQPESVYYYPDDINRPVFHQELGMSPQYHNLVYNYVKDFAGKEAPAQVKTFYPSLNNKDKHTDTPGLTVHFGGENEDKAGNTNDQKLTTEKNNLGKVTAKPGLNEYFLPSDILSLPNHPNNQFYEHFDAIKTKRINLQKGTSIPPIGGVISNYVLLRNHPNPQNLLQFPGSIKENEANLQHIKRQIPDDSDGVVILAEPIQNAKNSEEAPEHKEEEDSTTNKDEEEQMEAHPGIAQSKPSAIALAGPGGMAQASPVGTALVGQGGLAVAAPSGTAVAGPAGQGAIPIQIGGEKQKTTEKSEESDSD